MVNNIQTENNFSIAVKPHQQNKKSTFKSIFFEARFIYHEGCEKIGSDRHTHDHAHPKPKSKPQTGPKLTQSRDTVKQNSSAKRLEAIRQISSQANQAQKVEFYLVKNKTGPESIDKEKVDKFKTIINADTVRKLQKIRPKIFFEVFCSPYPPKDDFRFLVDKKGQAINNSSMDSYWGLVDSFPDPQVQAVIVYHNEVDSRYERSNDAPIGSFFDPHTGRYGPIRAGDRIKVVKRLSKKAAAQKLKVVKERGENQLNGLLKKMPEEVTKYFKQNKIPVAQVKKIIKQITIESVRSGGDARLFLLDIIKRHPEFLDPKNFNPNRFRWEYGTPFAINKEQYKKLTQGKKPIYDKHGNITLGFLAYQTRVQGLAAGQTFAAIRSQYQKICGHKLTGTEADIKQALTMARTTISSRAGGRMLTVEQAIEQNPALKQIWEDLKKFFLTQKIPFTLESKAQNGFVLMMYKKKLQQMATKPESLKVFKLLAKKDPSWKLNISLIPVVDNYANGSDSKKYKAKTYKAKTWEKFEKTKTIAEAEEILRNAPQEYLHMNFGSNITCGLRSTYGVRPPIPSVGIMNPNIHPASDVNMSFKPLHAPFPCRVVSMYNRAAYVRDANGNIKTWRGGKLRTRTCYIVVEGYDPRTGDMVRMSFVHLKAGSIPAKLRPGTIVQPGELIGITGNTGRSTAPHLHFTCRRKRAGQSRYRVTDPLVYMPPHMQRRIIQWRLRNPNYQHNFSQYKKSHYDNPRTQEVIEYWRRRGIDITGGPNSSYTPTPRTTNT